jgi:hypothetical protein
MDERETPGLAEFGFGPRNGLGALAPGLFAILVCIACAVVLIGGSVYYFILEVDTAGQRLAGAAVTAGLIAMIAYSIGPMLSMLAWIPRGIIEMRDQCVRATPEGILLDSTGTHCYRWSEIDSFEIGDVEVDSECGSTVGAVMILRNGRRIDVPALERSSWRPYNAEHVAQITDRVARLNTMLEQTARQQRHR